MPVKIASKVIIFAIIMIFIVSIGSIAPEDKKNTFLDMCYTTTLVDNSTNDKETNGQIHGPYQNLSVDNEHTLFSNVLCVISEDAEYLLRSPSKVFFRTNKYWLYIC